MKVRREQGHISLFRENECRKLLKFISEYEFKKT